MTRQDNRDFEMPKHRRKYSRREKAFGWVGAATFGALSAVLILATHVFGGLGLMAVVFGVWTGALVGAWGFAVGAALARITDPAQVPPVMTGWPVTAKKVPKSK